MDREPELIDLRDVRLDEFMCDLQIRYTGLQVT
jgi:hypothetical protein